MTNKLKKNIQIFGFLALATCGMGLFANYEDGLRIVSSERHEEILRFESFQYCGKYSCDYVFKNEEGEKRVMSFSRGSHALNFFMKNKDYIQLTSIEYNLKNKNKYNCIGKLYIGANEIENQLGLLNEIIGTKFSKKDCYDITSD